MVKITDSIFNDLTVEVKKHHKYSLSNQKKKVYYIQTRMTKFINWSENIRNKNTKIYFPHNDDEIINIINLAIEKKKTIRVVGSTHSISPTICSSHEENVLLVSLKDYHWDHESSSKKSASSDNSSNVLIDHERMTVTVNAGLT